MTSCTKVLLSEYIITGLQYEENVLLGVPKSDWFVSVDGVNECIWIMVQNSGKTNTFLICWHFLLGSMSAVVQNLCLSGLDFGVSLAQGNEELWCF